ncbi:MAG TPA: hypothetical protein VGW38_23045, partial [Chloroflexota bacterium]|nr:hypothetical protein [Chloroflexota bacterium]
MLETLQCSMAAEPPEFVRRLAPHEPALATQAAFALFAQVFLEQRGLIAPRFLPPDPRAPIELPETGQFAQAIGAIVDDNPHLLVTLSDPERRHALATVDPTAARDYLVWLRAQHLEREEPQIAYELGMLAMGVVLPSVYVRALRQLAIRPNARVVELPDGAGYPTVFLATLQPQWQPAGNVHFLVHSPEAEQLAAWALLLLSQRLEPAPGAITRVGAADQFPLTPD